MSILSTVRFFCNAKQIALLDLNAWSLSWELRYTQGALSMEMRRKEFRYCCNGLGL